MGTVHIRIGHDDDLFIAQIIQIELGPHAHAHGLAQIADFGIGGQLV